MNTDPLIITEMQDQAKWDAYVKSSPGGLPQHLSGWRAVMSAAYSYQTHYLMASVEGRIQGVLPLLVVRSRLVGSSVVSMPGGLCADDDETATALIARGMDIAREAKIKRLILQDTRQVWPGNLHTTTQHEHWLVSTQADADTLWKQLHKETRRQIRIAQKNELTVELDRNGGCLEEFHDVLSHFTHQAGTPIFGRDFVEGVVEAFAGAFSIAVVRTKKRAIGAYFQLEMGDTVYGLWGATLRQYLDLRPVYLAYWEILRDSSLNGFHFWDIGRSPSGSNASLFKRQWKGVSEPVYQQTVNIGGDQPVASIASRAQTDQKFRRFMQVWSRLPFSVSQVLGPKLRRHVPFA